MTGREPHVSQSDGGGTALAAAVRDALAKIPRECDEVCSQPWRFLKAGARQAVMHSPSCMTRHEQRVAAAVARAIEVAKETWAFAWEKYGNDIPVGDTDLLANERALSALSAPQEET